MLTTYPSGRSFSDILERILLQVFEDLRFFTLLQKVVKSLQASNAVQPTRIE